MIDNSNLSTYTNLTDAQASLEQAKAASLQKEKIFLNGFMDLQKAGEGVDATGICAGLAIYGYRLIQQLGPNKPLPSFPTKVPAEVRHLQMQLPKAALQTLPKGVDPQTVVRGKDDRLINRIMVVFQEFIQKEANVGIDAIFPGPNFLKSVKITASDPIYLFIVNLYLNTQSQNADYLFYLHKPEQPITKGHILYVNLKKGIIIDGKFGPFIWNIEQAALPHFENLLISYLRKNYADWNLCACRLKKEPSTLYSKLPVIIRSSLSYSQFLFDAARKIGIKKAGQVAISLLFASRKEQETEFHQQIRNVDSHISLTDRWKEYEKLGLKYEQFSGVKWDINCSLVPRWVNLSKANWPEIFKALDHLDPRLHSLKSKLQKELFERIYHDLVSRSKDKREFLELAYSLTFELLERRKNLSEKYSLNYIAGCITIHAPHAEKLLEILLMHGADPDDDGVDASPLFHACERGHVNLVKILLKYGANLHHPKYVHQLPLSKDNEEIAQLLEGPSSTHTLNNRQSYLLD